MLLTWFYETRITFRFNAFRLLGKLRVNGFHDALIFSNNSWSSALPATSVSWEAMAMNLVELIDRYNRRYVPRRIGTPWPVGETWT